MARQGNRGFIRNAYDAIIEARTRQVERYLASTFGMQDDATAKGKPDRRGGMSFYL